MATQQTDFSKFVSRNKLTQYDFDPGVATAVDVAWVDLRDYEGFVAVFFRTVGTGALDTFSIIANSQSDGGGTDAVIVVGMPVGADEPNAVGDHILIECSAEQLADASTSTTGRLRYVSVSAEFATDTDEGVVTYIRRAARRPTAGLSADVIA